MSGGNFGIWPGESHAARAPRMGSRLILGVPGGVSLGKESLPSCTCGARRVFDTDWLGRSLARCEGCGRVLPLADVPDPVLR